MMSLKTALAVAAVLLGGWSSHLWAVMQNYCEQGAGSTTVLLVDRTNPYDDRDKEVFANGVAGIYDRLQTGDRIIVHTLTDDFAKSEKVFDACRPGCREQGLVSGLFSQCRESVARIDGQSFMREYLTSVKQLIDEQEEYPASVIIETVAYIVQEYERNHLVSLVIFSDMIEHSSMSRFAYLSEKDVEKMLKKVEQLGLVKPMPEISVEIFGYGRSHSDGRDGLRPAVKQNIEHFWREYFRMAGVKSVRLGGSF
jgi:hypothetical protein